MANVPPIVIPPPQVKSEVQQDWLLKQIATYNLYNITNANLDVVSRKIESPDYITQFIFDKNRYVPQVDWTDPSNFARFGSAEQYYAKSIENIYRYYPYDGSLKERLEWHNNSSYLDNYIFEYEYPRTNGYIQIGYIWGTTSTTKTPGDGDTYRLSGTPQYIYSNGNPQAPQEPAYASGSYTKELNFKEKEQKANVFDSETNQMHNFTINGSDGNTVEFWMKLPFEPSKSQTSPSHAYFDLWNGEARGTSGYGRFLIETRYDTSIPAGEYIDDHFFHITYMSGTDGAERAAVGAKELTSSLGIDLSEWNHIGITTQNNGTTLDIKLYINGDLVETTTTGTDIGDVITGSFNATIGAYQHGPSALAISDGVSAGYGSLSGSYIDEFRFWKIHRDSDDIKFNWFKQIAGGTNTDYGTSRSKFYRDDNPVNLGVYYKFNEGIVDSTNASDHDKVVLDYSGRVSNGYISNYSVGMRFTGSAIVENGAAQREFKDPIVYSFHPNVVSYFEEATSKGREYDARNSMYLFNMLPTWIIEEDEFKGKNHALQLNQIIASYFDNLYLQIEKYPRLKDKTYVSGSASGSMNKPLPFAHKLLINSGLDVPEIFSNASVFESLANRDDFREFERKLSDVKNQIYSNIYNNLLSIYKSKGTVKSITNMMRCFGVDDDLYSINFYADNALLDLKGNFIPKTIRKSYADFSTSAKFGATVFQNTASSNSNSVSFITGSVSTNTSVNEWNSENSFTIETEVIFPNYPSDISNKGYRDYDYPNVSSSLFGMHDAGKDPSAAPGDTTWGSDDFANFQVYAVRESSNNINQESRNVRFILTSSNINSTAEGFISELSSETFKDVYTGERWNFAVRAYPAKYPNLGWVSGSQTTDYIIRFSGYNLIGDTVQNSFDITSSITAPSPYKEFRFLERNKRLYIGAHRTNFTGSLLTPSNVKVSSCRYWDDFLTNDELYSHALDPKNYGVYTPMKSTYLLQDLGGQYSVDVPRVKTLWMNWDFDNVTGSDTGEYGGEFSVSDFSSGSSDNRYKSYISSGSEKQHTGRGVFFPSGTNQTGSISREYVNSYRQQVPDNINNLASINVLSRDDEYFTRRTKPVTFSMTVEKSMYQNISEEMINFLAASKDASGMAELFTQPVEKYRDRYKSMEKMRNIFFERVSNTPDVDKYIEYFKWLDTSISQMISQIVPASSNFSSVRNIVESHVFERSGKYKHKFPTIETKQPKKDNLNQLFNFAQYEEGHSRQGTYDARITSPIRVQDVVRRSLGGNTSVGALDARRLISWQNASAPVDSTSEDSLRDNAFWWRRVPFSADTAKTTGDSSRDTAFNLTTDKLMVDVERAGYNLIYNTQEVPTERRNADNGFIFNVDGGGDASSFNNQSRSRPKKDVSFRNIVFNEAPAGSGNRISFNTSTFSRQANVKTKDKINPLRKFKPEFELTIPSKSTEKAFDGRKFSPLSFQSSSTDNPYVTGSSPWYVGYELSTQHLQDYYLENKDVPMQGPFTEQNVGGYAFRHGGLKVEVNALGTGFNLKPEGWYAFRTITTSPDGIRFDFYNPYDLPNGENYPRALYTRGGLAKRPLNIRNIKSTTGSYLPQRTDIPPVNELGNTKVSIGNYEKDYQIVQIPNRDVNNRYFVDNDGISTASAPSTGTPSVSGAYDWTVPDRGRNEHIFVSRFSAPGGPEVNGSAFLNYESEVYSVYNALPFRNLSVRQPLRTLLTRHTAFGGYDSELGSPSASYKKTQRNARKYIEYTDIFQTAATRSAYDNYFVQHQIPQSDMQYAWITASATNVIYGFEQPNYENASYASTDIVFASSSDFGAYEISAGTFIFGTTRGAAEAAGDAFIPTNFAGLNTIAVPDSDSFDDNTLFYDPNGSETFIPIINSAPPVTTVGSVASLNGQLLNNNGPYGFSTWKQIQNSYNRIVRYMKRINRFSILKEKTSISPGDAKQQSIKTQTLENFTEPMVSFKYKPIEHDLAVEGIDGSINKIEIDSTFANELGTFANNKIDELLNFKKNVKDSNVTYNSLKDLYSNIYIESDASSVKSLDKLSYREVVYPRERNTGLGKTRGRQNYTVSSGSDEFNVRLGDSVAFWKNNIADRLRSDAEARNAEGLIIASGSSYFGLTDMSIWPLDAEEPFFDMYLFSSSAGAGGGGYSPYYWAPLEPSSGVKGLDPASISRLSDVNKNGELSYAGWIYSLLGINIQGKVRIDNAPTSSGPFPNFGGDGTADDGLNFRPSSSFQYEYPSMMLSGAMAGRGVSPSASLHLIAPYRADVLSGKTPWFNSYEDYSEDIRRIAKDYTVIPEFRISDHIDYYLNNGFFADNNKFLDLVGSSLANTSSAANETGSLEPSFFKIYSHSDFMKHFSVIQEDHKKNDTAFASKIRLEANAVKKLLPYQGFYPALRAVQLGHLFSASYAPYITGSNVRDGDQERLAALYQPFFAPGVFFNTVKSGIAVSYPVHTASAPVLEKNATFSVQQTVSASGYVASLYKTTPNYLFPFEAILEPDQYIPVSSSLTSSGRQYVSSSVYFVYPNFTGSYRETVSEAFYARQTQDSPYTSNTNQPQIYFEWQGQSDPKYSLAASNFFAESVDFFLEKGTLTSFISKTEKDFKSMTSGSTYYMDVLLYKSNNFVSYEGPSGTFNYDGGVQLSGGISPTAWHSYANSFGDGIKNQPVSARGMHYGPAYRSCGLLWGSTGTGSVPYASFGAQDPAYAPHTPPYFYGTSRARIAFKPDAVRDMATGEAAKFTLEEILSNCKIETEYQNDNELSKTLQENTYRNSNAAGIAQMQISSSINLFGQVTLKEIQYGTERNPDGTFKADRATTPVVQGTNDAWIIETKFECPSINLANMDTVSLGARSGDGREKYATRGVWKGYGQYPTGSEGLFLQLKESYPQVINDIGGDNSAELTGSLIEICGFKASKQKVGKIRAKKTISEAIVAVPIDEKGNFFGINTEMFQKQKLNYETNNKALIAGDFGVESDIGETSITDMIQKMKRFNIPPHMDFLNNPNVDPFVMYIFDFTHSLDRQDLVDIWQNLMPKISTTAEKQSKAIEHTLGVNYEFFGQYKQGQLPSNIRWMVFKVKQKARNNYFNVTQQSEVGKGFTFSALQELQGISSNPEAELAYSYNWPYDFFSLVELAQVESEITFEPPKE